MDYIIGIVLALCVPAILVAIYTSWAFWIGFGFIGIFLLFLMGSRIFLRYDYSGDAGIPYMLCILFPSLIGSITFLLAALIKYLVIGYL